MSRGFHRLSRRGFGAIGLLLGLVLWAMPAAAQCVSNVCTVATASDLVNALTTIDTTPGTYTINMTADITLTSGTTLPAITGSANNVTINGANHTVDGGSVQRGFFVYQGTVAINDLTIQNTVAKGGAGGWSKRRRRRRRRARRRLVRGQRRHGQREQCQPDEQRRGRRRGRAAAGDHLLFGGGGGLGGAGGIRSGGGGGLGVALRAAMA